MGTEHIPMASAVDIVSRGYVKKLEGYVNDTALLQSLQKWEINLNVPVS